MTDARTPTDAQRQMWMAQWLHAAVALARVRADELARTDIRVLARQLEDASLLAIRQHPPLPSSGLVDQQRIFHSARALEGSENQAHFLENTREAWVAAEPIERWLET